MRGCKRLKRKIISDSCILLLLISVVEPLNVAAVLPDADFASAINLDESASAVLLAVEPLTLVDASIFPPEHALSLSLVADELPLVLLSVGPL